MSRMKGSYTSWNTGHPPSKVQRPEDVEQHMRMAARMLYTIIVDHRQQHLERAKPADEAADATKTDKSP